MKKILVYFFAFILIFFSSCSKIMSPRDYGVVSCQINLSDLNKILTKSNSMEKPYLCGINVYYDEKKDGNTTSCYARGLFDDMSQAKIDLMQGYHYRFQVTLFTEGADKMRSGKYVGSPFDTFDSYSSTVDNEFLYGQGPFKNFETGVNISGVIYGIPNVKRYYGELNDYYPHTGEDVTVSLKNVSFAVKILVDSFSEGNIEFSITNGSTSLYKTTIKSVGTDLLLYFSFPDAKKCWEGNQEEIKCTIGWKYNSEKYETYSTSKSCELFFKRNTITTIELSGSTNSNAFEFDIDENFDDGEDLSYIINDDGVLN